MLILQLGSFKTNHFRENDEAVVPNVTKKTYFSSISDVMKKIAQNRRIQPMFEIVGCQILGNETVSEYNASFHVFLFNVRFCFLL